VYTDPPVTVQSDPPKEVRIWRCKVKLDYSIVAV
jgi:hypothetical protein